MVPKFSTATGWKMCVLSKPAHLAALRVAAASAAEPAFVAESPVRLSQGADYSDVPGEWLSFSPRHHLPIRTFAVCPGETLGFFGHRYCRRRKGASHQVVECVMLLLLLSSSSSFLAHQHKACRQLKIIIIIIKVEKLLWVNIA